VVAFANLAIEGLAFAGPAIGTIGTPLTVQRVDLAGRTTPVASYAVAIAAVVSLMFVTLLLAAGMLALERSENAYLRLVRGLVGPGALLVEKVALAGVAAALLSLILSAIVSIFVPLEWGRFELWVLALIVAGVAFAAMGVAIGGLAREVSAASLMAFLLSLPVAFIALIPSTAVSSGVASALSVVSFVFPFRAGLQAVSNAFSGTSPGMIGPLVHLIVLAGVFGALARLALRRFATV
jgi:ABC-2 type transport system permease protein